MSFCFSIPDDRVQFFLIMNCVGILVFWKCGSWERRGNRWLSLFFLSKNKRIHETLWKDFLKKSDSFFFSSRVFRIMLRIDAGGSNKWGKADSSLKMIGIWLLCPLWKKQFNATHHTQPQCFASWFFGKNGRYGTRTCDLTGVIRCPFGLSHNAAIYRNLFGYKWL